MNSKLVKAAEYICLSKKHMAIMILLMIPFTVCSQTPQNINKVDGAKRFINSFDFDLSYYQVQPVLINSLTKNTSVNATFDQDIKYQGKMSLKCSFQFSKNEKPEYPEIARLQKIWNHNFRSDLSFHPVGVSFWINSDGSDNRLIVSLLQQNETFTLDSDKLNSFSYTDDSVLKKKGWQQIVIPYEKFTSGSNNTGGKINLARINGYRFDIVNISGKEHKGYVYLDALEQLTSFRPEISVPARFTSIFIQLHPSHHLNYDWNNLFESYLEVGIDTLIIQRSALGSKVDDSATFYYKTDKVSWKSDEYDIIENIFTEAEKTGMKIILGLHGGRYPDNKGDTSAYVKLYNKNVELIDDLYSKFGSSRAMAGWYICEEFHDGVYKGWWKIEDRMLLANYQQKVAAYAKSKPNKYIVAIAPALWRGRPADMTYNFFKSYFTQTPDIDILYLQDCGGRCSVDEGDFDVVLPHWYSYIKKACDETGIQFGVDIESFKRCPSENIKWHSKEWSQLKDQLIYAGLYTKNITQFSWTSFRPGVGSFEAYKEYLRENNMLKVKTDPIASNHSKIENKQIDLYLLIGQSNMAGRGFIEKEDTVSHPRVLVLNKDYSFENAKEPLHYDKKNRGTGPGFAFAKFMANFYPKYTIGIIPAAVGGTKVSYWQPGNERGLYEEALHKTREAMKYGKLKGILWQQGESDSNAQDAPFYKNRLINLLTQLRKELGDETIPIVLGGVPDFLNTSYYVTINKSLKEISKEMNNVSFSEASQLGHIGDQLHFNSAAQRENGSNMAKEMIILQIKKQ